jgi:hypothetical protein
MIDESGVSEQRLSDICGINKKRAEWWERMSEYNAFMSDEENRGLIEGWEGWARFTGPECNHATKYANHRRKVVMQEYNELSENWKVRETCMEAFDM